MDIKIFREQFLLVCSILKWCLFSILVGIIVGTVAAGFLRLLDLSIAYMQSLGWWHYLLLFAALMFSYYFVRLVAPEAAGHGTEKVIESLHNKAGVIDIKVIPVRLIASIITISAGGSAGKEGPCAQIGAGLMYGVSRIFGLDESDRKKLVICGISAGFSAVFGTPITGAIFGVEVLFVEQVFYDVLLPSFVSGIVACFTAAQWGIGHLPEFSVAVPHLDPALIMWSLIAGAFFGFVSMLHIESLKAFEHGFKTMKIQEWQKPLLGAGLLLLIGLIFGTRYLGLGLETISEAVRGDTVPILAFILKSIAMSITLSSGGSGGVLTPTLFVGATAGSLFGRIFGLDPAMTSAMGLVAVLAGSTNTPIASTILAMELFGAAIAPFAGLACVVSYIVSGHRSLYPSQIMIKPKARTFVRRKNAEGVDEMMGRFAGISYTRILNFCVKYIKNRIQKQK